MKKKASPDIRLHLKNYLEEKQRKNKNFSLRAWAKQLGISPGNLSKLMNQKASVSEKTFALIAEKLNLSAQEILFYKRSVKEKKKLKTARRNIVPISLDLPGEILRDWEYRVLLEIGHLDHQPDFNSLKQDLNISDERLKHCLDNLKKHNLLKTTDSEKFQPLPENLSTIFQAGVKPDLSAGQIQMLEKSIESIRNVAPEFRDHTSITLAIDSSLLPIAKEKIKNFRRELATYLTEHSIDKNAVYEMDFGLFPLLLDSQEEK